MRVDGAEASARAEQFVLGALMVVRVAALAQGGLSIAGSWDRFAYPALVVAAFGLVIASSVAVVAIALRRGALGPGSVAVVDVCCTLAALVTIAWAMRGSADPAVDDVIYPYSAAALAIVGFIPVRLRWAYTAAGAATLVYVGAVSARFGFRITLLENSATYWAYALASWLLAGRFREMGRSLDRAQAAAVARERDLERVKQEHDRMETYRGLHDHVLQTMESLSRNGWLDDERVRREIDREAAWLRALIHNELDPHPPELVAALQAVVYAQAETGLDVELNTAAAQSCPVPAAVVEALAGAVTEALTNVRKHAGCARCVVRATVSPNRATVTVLDRGRGFDPAAASTGIGMSQSIVGRLRRVGGTARISSTPGSGTLVELDVPLVPPDVADASADGSRQQVRHRNRDVSTA